MKIRRVELRQETLEFRDPDWRTSTHATTSSPALYVGVETEHMTGVGASSVNERQATTTELVDAFEQRIRPSLEGASISAARQSLRLLRGTVPARLLLALDLGIHDLLGKLAGVPAEAMWGGACRDRVRVIRMVGLKSPEELSPAVARLVAEGFGAVKLKIGTGVEEDVERVRRLRTDFGDALDIMVDANGAYTPDEAIRLAHGLADHGVSLLEQPVAYDSVEALAQVTRNAPLDIVADQCASDVASVYEVCRQQAADAISVKLTKMGTIEECLRTIAVCEAFGMPVHLGGSPAPSLVDAAASRLALSQPAIVPDCEVGESAALSGDPYPSMEIVDGHATSPGTPGIGAPAGL